MTREEIEELKGLAASMGLYDDKKPCKRAMILGKAIKALDQEPCEDAISRQAAIDKIYESRNNFYNEFDQGFFADKIRDLPSVTPQPKTGHWIWELEDWNKWTCSVCGWAKRTDVHITLGYKYCPSCGTKMQKSEVEE